MCEYVLIPSCDVELSPTLRPLQVTSYDLVAVAEFAGSLAGYETVNDLPTQKLFAWPAAIVQVTVLAFASNTPASDEVT